MGCAPSKKRTKAEVDPSHKKLVLSSSTSPAKSSAPAADYKITKMAAGAAESTTPTGEPATKLNSTVQSPQLAPVELANLRSRAKDLFALLKTTATPCTYSTVRNRFENLEQCKETSLCLPGSVIGGDLGAEIFSIGITFSTKLETVHLGFCEIGPRGARALANAIKHHPSLKNFALGGYAEPHDDSAVADFVMARSFAVSLQDQRFEKARNRIGDEAAVIIAAAIRDNQQLESVDLSETDIGDKAVFELVKATNRHPTMKYLCLAHNDRITDKSGRKYGFREGLRVDFE